MSTEFFKKGEDHMKKWKAIFFGTLLTLSLCTFTACGTDVNNADETVDEKENNAADSREITGTRRQSGAAV